MRCGNCKDNHDSVAEVRSCYGARPSAPYPRRAPAAPAVLVGASAPRTAAPSPSPSTSAPAAPVGAGTLDFSNVHVGERDRSGRYAVDLDGDLRFLRVDKPNYGKWSGWIFVKHEVSEQAFPVLSVRPNGSMSWRAQALEPHVRAMLADPEKAALLYGEMFTRCALCNVRLTKPESIERKIGPICAGKAGW